MRLLMFDHGDGPRLGVLAASSSDIVIDLTELAKATGSTPPPANLIALIDAGEAGMASVKQLVAKLKPSAAAPITQSVADVRVLAPLDPPRGNVIAIGRNYAKHAVETAAKGETPKPPTVFSKAITSITGPNEDIPIDPGVSEEIDWEVELGVVIGKAGVNITREDALEHVFGYTVINDVTARDIQSDWGGQYFKGKSLDASCPSGPWVVTPDEVEDPQALNLRLTVNGVLKQDGTTSEMIHPVDSIIEWVSVGMTLLPGMMIATGTPDGVGFARKPPEFIHVGDMVEAEVEGIGTLRNRFVMARNPRRMD
ncbi:MAG TPA: fumarylacetoacetate hydrolase family protein [Candidatus Acidoferrum sp.]|jgi:2-keto-4-pentenoate hydratase/2-oxohepta-3-ene-1,7-dioic acid hydratase in catechol pathway|nr:fumarylacetoacetate hydrolase family protein [Candidatus Acidoferrum sp.]